MLGKIFRKLVKTLKTLGVNEGSLMLRQSTLPYLVGAGILLVSIYLFMMFLNPQNLGLLLNGIAVAAAAATVYAGITVIRQQKKIFGVSMRAPWFFISLGFFFWFAGEVCWFIEPKPCHIRPISLADLMWVIGYVCVLYGFGSGLRPLTRLARVLGGFKASITCAAPLLLASLLLSLMAPCLQRIFLEKGSLAALVDFIYVFLDIAVFTVAMEGAVFLGWRSRAKGLIIMSAGLIMLAISDIPYSLVGGYWPGNPLDLLYALSYMVIATGVYEYSRQPVVI